MSILSFALWVQDTDFFSALRISAYVYPIVMSLHLAGIALFGGMVLTTDLRLLGVAFRNWPVSDVIGQLRVLKRIGLVLVVVCGLLLLGSKAEEYYYNVFFRVKLLLLALVAVHALVFRHSVYGNSAQLDKLPRLPFQARMAAILSLLLWTGLIVAGRGIGYIQVPMSLHASVSHGL